MTAAAGVRPDRRLVVWRERSRAKRTKGDPDVKIVVCIKQVPATTNVRIDPKTNALIREGVESETNPFDENAIEAALQVKESVEGGCEVVALCMGPPQAEAVRRDAIARGCEEGILLTDARFRGGATRSRRPSRRSAMWT